MDLNSIKKCDRTYAQRLLNFKLPNYWKRIGWIGFAITMAALVARKFLDLEFDVLREVLKKLSLLFLFLVVLSREKIEDERIEIIRTKAYSVSFLGAVLYVLFQPIANYIAFLIVKPEKAAFDDLGDFQIIWFMLCIYLLVFYILKKV